MSRKEHISVPFLCFSCAFSLFQVLHACNPYLSKTCVNRIIRNKNEQARKKTIYFSCTTTTTNILTTTKHVQLYSILLVLHLHLLHVIFSRSIYFPFLLTQPINSKAIHENCVGLWEIEQKRNELVFSPGTFQVRKGKKRERKEDKKIEFYSGSSHLSLHFLLFAFEIIVNQKLSLNTVLGQQLHESRKCFCYFYYTDGVVCRAKSRSNGCGCCVLICDYCDCGCLCPCSSVCDILK